MTNHQTVQKSIDKLKSIEAMREDGRYDLLTKKERLGLDRQHESLMKNLAGIKDMKGLPDMLFIIDVRKEDIAVAEANRLNIPVVAVVDTNCSPEGISQVIPGNDDALRAIRLFASRIADAIMEGKNIATEGVGTQAQTDETAATSDDENALEPTIQVADQSFAFAETTHPISVEDENSAAGVAQADGAFGNQESTPIRTQIQQPSSEDITKVTSKSSGEKPLQQESNKEESNEAVAS
jgi:small subunit ribosomal protein S2